MTQAQSGPAAAGNLPPALALHGINKRFSTVHANKDVSLSVAKGTIHGIIGENGAGKSTLMSIVYGYYQADSGTIEVDGERVSIKEPQDALGVGIGMVHQHFMLVNTFTVLENVVLGVEGGMTLGTGMDAARKELEHLEKEYSLEVDPDAIIGDLPVGLQQRVEILKALYRGAETLVLDEPTGVLTPQEVDHLFRILHALRDQGKTIILITHKLREIMALTDNVTVMRQGEVVANVKTADTSREQLAELMVGRSVLLRVEKTPAQPTDVCLAVKGLNVIDGNGVRRVKDVDFDVRYGEIVGIAGVSGNGQSELLEALSGIRPVDTGDILFKGENLAAMDGHLSRWVREHGMGHVPEDRQHMGLVLDFHAFEDTILGYHHDPLYNRHGLLNYNAITGQCADWMQGYDVRPAVPEQKAGDFSGGNQQKIVLAREMERDPELLLVGQPTRGVDIGAIEFIHKRLIAMRDAGKAILLVSVELDEIMSLADRILVMFDGMIVGEMPQGEATEQQLGLLMAGESTNVQQGAS